MFEFQQEVIYVEELSVPRPHYRVTTKITMLGHLDLLPSFLRDEMTMTVHVPMDVGSDLNTIKQVAAHQLATHVADIADHQPTRRQTNANPTKSLQTKPSRRARADRSQGDRQPMTTESNVE